MPTVGSKVSRVHVTTAPPAKIFKDESSAARRTERAIGLLQCATRGKGGVLLRGRGTPSFIVVGNEKDVRRQRELEEAVGKGGERYLVACFEREGNANVALTFLEGKVASYTDISLKRRKEQGAQLPTAVVFKRAGRGLCFTYLATPPRGRETPVFTVEYDAPEGRTGQGGIFTPPQGASTHPGEIAIKDAQNQPLVLGEVAIVMGPGWVPEGGSRRVDQYSCMSLTQAGLEKVKDALAATAQATDDGGLPWGIAEVVLGQIVEANAVEVIKGRVRALWEGVRYTNKEYLEELGVIKTFHAHGWMKEPPQDGSCLCMRDPIITFLLFVLKVCHDLWVGDMTGEQKEMLLAMLIEGVGSEESPILFLSWGSIHYRQGSTEACEWNEAGVNIHESILLEVLCADLSCADVKSRRAEECYKVTENRDLPGWTENRPPCFGRRMIENYFPRDVGDFRKTLVKEVNLRVDFAGQTVYSLIMDGERRIAMNVRQHIVVFKVEFGQLPEGRTLTLNCIGRIPLALREELGARRSHFGTTLNLVGTLQSVQGGAQQNWNGEKGKEAVNKIMDDRGFSDFSVEPVVGKKRKLQEGTPANTIEVPFMANEVSGGVDVSMSSSEKEWVLADDLKSGTRQRWECRSTMKDMVQCEYCKKEIKISELHHWFLLVAPAVHVCQLQCFWGIGSKIRSEAAENPEDEEKQSKLDWFLEIQKDYLG